MIATKKISCILCAILIGTALLTGCGGKEPAATIANAVAAEAVLTDVALTSEDFEKNKLTVINVWGTWCPPCVGELPELQKVSEAYKDKEVEIVGVLQDDIKKLGVPDNSVIQSANVLLQDAGVTYRIILPDEYLQTEFIDTMQYFPTTFFLDSSGTVIKTVTGANEFDAWSKLIDETLESLEG